MPFFLALMHQVIVRILDAGEPSQTSTPVSYPRSYDDPAHTRDPDAPSSASAMQLRRSNAAASPFLWLVRYVLLDFVLLDSRYVTKRFEAELVSVAALARTNLGARAREFEPQLARAGFYSFFAS